MIPRIQEYAEPENTKKAIKFRLKIYKGWKRLTDRLPTFEQFQDMSLAITDFINLMYQSIFLFNKYFYLFKETHH